MKSIFKTFALSLLLISQVHFAYSQTAALLPNASQVFLDNNAKPLSSGKVSFYIPGTLTSKMVWQDANQTVPWTQPITLNAAGRPPGDKGIYGNGTYRQIVKSSSNATIWDQPTAAVGTGGGSGTSVGDGNSVGTILAWSGMVAPNQYQFAYGQNLSRTTYPELLAATTLTTSITCIGGNTTITGISDTSNIPVGAAVEANCIVAGSTVISKTISTVTLSVAANVSNTTSARFFPYGNGNGSTTFTVVDMRGKVAPGRTNMGGVTASNLTSTYYGSSPDAVGANGGSQSKSLSVVNLAQHNHGVFLNDPGHNHPIFGISTLNGTGTSISATTNFGPAQPANMGTTNNNTTGITVRSASGGGGTQNQTADTGSGTAFAIIPPSITLNYIIKVTPDTSVSGLFGVASIGGMQGIITCGTGLVCVGNDISVSVAPVTNTDNVNYTAPYTNSVQINQTVYNAVRVSVREFGAIGNGVADDTTAIQNALNSTAGAIYFPSGTYKLAGACLTLSSAKTLYGDGTYESILNATGCTNNALTIASGLSGVNLNNFAVIRSGGAISGQNGIHFNNLTEQANLDNLRIEGNWINLRLGITSYSFVNRVLSNNAYSNGFMFTNADGAGGLQWYLFDTLSQQSDGDGYRVETVTSNASVGTWTNAKTFANKGKGMRFVGSVGNPLQAIRLFGGFVGQDCDDEIYLDTYGSSTHTIEGMFIEIAGTSSCGVNLTTPATNVGHGISLTANNTAVAITNNNIIGNSYSGISTSAARVQITNNNLRINGAAGVGGELAGIAILAGNAAIVGNSSKAQQFGITLSSDNNVVTGNDLTENIVTPLLSSVNLISSVVSNNLPASTAITFTYPQTGHGDSAYVINQYDSTIYTNAAFTASRTWTLPAANTVPPNKKIFIVDAQGTVTSSNTLVVARTGADTINGATTFVINSAYGGAEFYSDGISKWSSKLNSVPSGGTGKTTFTANNPLIGNGTGPLAQGTRAGNTTVFATTSGALVNGNCAKFDANGNIVDNGAVCGGGGGGSPGGSTTQVQFNNAGAFGGSANMVWVSPKLTLGATGTTGQFGIAGTTSGNVTQTVQAIAGTPTITWGNTSGTPAVTASSPLTITAATGNMTCTTCGVTGSPLSQFAATTSSQLLGVLSDETGSGLAVFNNGPTLIAPALGTPASGVMTNVTGLPIASGVSGLGTGVATALAVNIGSAGAPVLFNGALGTPSSGTLTNATGLPISGITGLGSNVGTWLGTPSSSNLASAVTDETGTGLLVFSTNPVFSTNITTPVVIGGTAVGSSLTLQTTSGVGVGADSILFKGGNNGANTIASMTASGASGFGQLGVGTSSALQTNMIAAFKGAGNGVMTIGQDPGLTNYAGLWTTNGTPSGANYNFIADSTGADPLLYFNAPGVTGQMVFQTNTISIVQYDSAKHVRTMTPAPSLSSCGTSPVISGSDTAGEITMGTGSPTGCVLTFNVAHTNPPYCTVTWQSNLASMQYAIAASTITLTQTATSSNKVNYVCYARSGG